MSDSQNPKSLARNLFEMTWPMVFGVLSLMSYQLVDSAFIGQLGLNPLAAVGFTLPIYLVVIGLQVGIGVATTAVISQALGRKQEEYARETGSLIVITGSAAVLVFLLILWLIHKPLLMFLGGTDEVAPYFSDYWVFWLPSAFFGAFLYFGYSICRSHGNTMLPGITMVITSLLNIVFDPIFIFVLDLGIQGAAIATILAYTIGCMIVFPKVINNQWLSTKVFTSKSIQTLREISGIAAPAMVSQLLPSVSAIVATIVVAGFGTNVVAAWGLGGRMEFFSIVVILALTMSMPPLVGKFLGANRIDDIEKLVKIAVKFVLAWQLVVATIWLWLTPYVTPLMTSDQSVEWVVQDYIRLIPFSYGPLGICMVLVSTCNAMSEPIRGLAISVMRLFICYLPCLYLGGILADVQGLIIGSFVGNIVAGALAWFTYRQGIRQIRDRNLATQPA